MPRVPEWPGELSKLLHTPFLTLGNHRSCTPLPGLRFQPLPLSSSRCRGTPVQTKPGHTCPDHRRNKSGVLESSKSRLGVGGAWRQVAGMPSSTIDSELFHGKLRERTTTWLCLDVPLLGFCFPSQRPGALPSDEVGRREEGNPEGGRKEPASLLRPQSHLPHTQPPSRQRNSGSFPGAKGGEDASQYTCSLGPCCAAQPRGRVTRLVTAETDPGLHRA